LLLSHEGAILLLLVLLSLVKWVLQVMRLDVLLSWETWELSVLPTTGRDWTSCLVKPF
jgi:hypothetical protein